MKPKLLFLDDRTGRLEMAFRKFSGEFEITIATTVKECLRQMCREDYAEIHMEHDLGGEDFVNPFSPDSGMEVVRYIEITGWPWNKKRPIFKVHSLNLFAAFLMVTTLKKIGMMAFYEPFEKGVIP